MIQTSESIVALTGAIIKVQGGISGVHKNAKNSHFRSSYATLENVIDTARPALQEAGIAFIQAPGQVVDGSVEVTTMLVHESGEWMRSTLHVPLGKRDPQGVGSAITYGCRYSLMAMLGLPPTDDDGEAAMDRSEPPRKANGLPEKGYREDGTRTSYALKTEQPELWAEFQRELAECQTLVSLERFRTEWRAKATKEKWNRQYLDTAKDQIDGRAEAIAKEMERLMDASPDELAELPVQIALEHSLRNSPLRAG